MACTFTLQFTLPSTRFSSSSPREKILNSETFFRTRKKFERIEISNCYQSNFWNKELFPLTLNSKYVTKSKSLLKSNKTFIQASSDFDRNSKTDKEESIQLYGRIERVFSESAKRSQNFGWDTSRWKEIEGAWVLKPEKKSIAVVHFIGGAFVGASPQLTYRLFLETLSKQGIFIIATPFVSGFDHLRIADESQFKFDRCVRAMDDPELENLPVFGIGHSLGALTHMLIGSRYAVERTGNILLSFNNKEATKAIPAFSPVILPMAQNFGPIWQQLSASSTFRMGADMALKQLKGLNPQLAADVLPLFEQLSPLYQDLSNGKDEFVPTPEDTKRLVKSYYGVRRNLLIKFKDDTIDETADLAEILSKNSSVSEYLDLSIRSLPGTHVRPLQQLTPEIPKAMVDVVTQGGAFLNTFASGTPLAQIAKTVEMTVGVDGRVNEFRASVEKDMGALVDELCSWMISITPPLLNKPK